jgi:hypothetical protein
MNPNPQLITNNLLRRIEECWHQVKVTDIKLLSLEDDAKKLKAANPLDYYITSGLIAGLRGDLPRVGDLYTAATHSSDSYLVHYNFSMAFAKAGGYRLALLAVIRAFQTADLTNSVSVLNLGYSAMRYGLIKEALRMRVILEKLQADKFNGEFLAAIPELSNLGFTNVHEKIMLVYDVLEKHRVIVHNVELQIYNLLGEDYAEYVFEVGIEDVKHLVEYQFEADGAVAQYEIDNNLPIDSLGFRFTRQKLRLS